VQPLIRQSSISRCTPDTPPSWQHINLLGEYDFSDEKLRIRWESNPQNWRTKGTHFWESQKEQNSKAATALDKILFRIWYLCWNLTKVALASEFTGRANR
jgi:hypothetical protein